jgi:hypothetical protein
MDYSLFMFQKSFLEKIYLRIRELLEDAARGYAGEMERAIECANQARNVAHYDHECTWIDRALRLASRSDRLYQGSVNLGDFYFVFQTRPGGVALMKDIEPILKTLWKACCAKKWNMAIRTIRALKFIVYDSAATIESTQFALQLLGMNQPFRHMVQSTQQNQGSIIDIPKPK